MLFQNLLKYFRLLVGSAVDICRPFLYAVLVVSVFSQPQLTIKNEIGNPFRGSLSHFFVGAILQQPLVHIVVVCGFNRKFYKQCNIHPCCTFPLSDIEIEVPYAK